MPLRISFSIWLLAVALPLGQSEYSGLRATKTQKALSQGKVNDHNSEIIPRRRLDEFRDFDDDPEFDDGGFDDDEAAVEEFEGGAFDVDADFDDVEIEATALEYNDDGMFDDDAGNDDMLDDGANYDDIDDDEIKAEIDADIDDGGLVEQFVQLEHDWDDLAPTETYEEFDTSETTEEYVKMDDEVFEEAVDEVLEEEYEEELTETEKEFEEDYGVVGDDGGDFSAEVEEIVEEIEEGYDFDDVTTDVAGGSEEFVEGMHDDIDVFDDYTPEDINVPISASEVSEEFYDAVEEEKEYFDDVTEEEEFLDAVEEEEQFFDDFTGEKFDDAIPESAEIVPINDYEGYEERFDDAVIEEEAFFDDAIPEGAEVTSINDYEEEFGPIEEVNRMEDLDDGFDDYTSADNLSGSVDQRK